MINRGRRRQRRNGYSRDLLSLRDHIRDGIVADDFADLLTDYFEAEGDGVPDRAYDDPRGMLADDSSLAGDFECWLTESLRELDRDHPSLDMEVEDVLSPETWLVHFSNHADAITQEGFTIGRHDRSVLAYGQSADDGYEGWNFAYKTDGQFRNSGWWAGYGDKAVVFQSAGLLVWHDGDDEEQVIFWGPSVRAMVLIGREKKVWAVRSGRTGRLLRKGDIESVLTWVTDHAWQYRRDIVRTVRGGR